MKFISKFIENKSMKFKMKNSINGISNEIYFIWNLCHLIISNIEIKTSPFRNIFWYKNNS